MSEPANIIELFVVPGRGLLSSLVRSATDANPLQQVVFSQSDNATLRVRFFADNLADNTLTPIDYGVISIGFAGRPADALEDDALFQADAFSRTEVDGDIYYDSPVTFATISATDALHNKFSAECTCDLQTGGPATKARFNATLYREIYRGGDAPPPEADTWPTASSANAAIANCNAAATEVTDALAAAHFDGDVLVFNGIESPPLTGQQGIPGAMTGTAGVVEINESGAATIVLTDEDHNGRVLEVYTSTEMDITVLELNDTLPAGFACEVVWVGLSGNVTITLASGSTRALLQADSLYSLRAVGSIASIRTTTTRHVLAGDLA